MVKMVYCIVREAQTLYRALDYLQMPKIQTEHNAAKYGTVFNVSYEKWDTHFICVVWRIPAWFCIKLKRTTAFCYEDRERERKSMEKTKLNALCHSFRKTKDRKPLIFARFTIPRLENRKYHFLNRNNHFYGDKKRNLSCHTENWLATAQKCMCENVDATYVEKTT